MYAGTDRFIGGRSGEDAVKALLFEPTCTICGVETGYTGPGMKTVLLPTSPGTGPMHALGHPLGVPIVSIGCGYWGSNSHAPDEHIRLGDFEETIVMIAQVLERFAQAS